jgi:hypothetical protein
MLLKHSPNQTTPDQQVSLLQIRLRSAGYNLKVDGFFGPKTESCVRSLQNKATLACDGIVGPDTWNALSKALGQSSLAKNPNQHTETSSHARAEDPDAMQQRYLPGFHGDLHWIHQREGHAGKPYWPGGASGITLDPGLDLGHAKPALIQSAYQDLLTAEQWQAVESVMGITGDAAKKKLHDAEDPMYGALSSIRVSREMADPIFILVASPYWLDACKRFPGLGNASTPSTVQTAMLSIVYNRGVYNKALLCLKPSIQHHDWQKMGHIIAGMQQSHKLPGISKRRRMEGGLILQGIA